MNLVEHTKYAIDRATNLQSDLTKQVLTLEGMSSAKVRHFLNNITNFSGCKYLEIGCYKGSTTISALYKRNVSAYWVIDNFNIIGAKDQFLTNFNTILGYPPNLIDADFVSFNPIDRGISGVNTYFYDGDHSNAAQREAVIYYLNSLADEFIFIVDDWNGLGNQDISGSTIHAIEECNLQILFSVELPSSYNCDKSQWWNGLFVSVLKKR